MDHETIELRLDEVSNEYGAETLRFFLEGMGAEVVVEGGIELRSRDDDADLSPATAV